MCPLEPFQSQFFLESLHSASVESCSAESLAPLELLKPIFPCYSKVTNNTRYLTYALISYAARTAAAHRKCVTHGWAVPLSQLPSPHCAWSSI